MNYCPTCQQPIKPAPAEAMATERKYVKIPSPEGFRNLCQMLLSSPNCTDPKFRGPLEDFPKAIQKYGQLTEGQWKFFCAIHIKVFGTWPPKPEQITPPQVKADDGCLDNVPF